MRRTREQTRLSKLEDAPATVTDVAKTIKRELRSAAAAAVVNKESVVVVEKKTKKNEPLKLKKETVAQVAAAVKSESKEMAEYERKRLENIQRNLEFMKSMGVSTVRIRACYDGFTHLPGCLPLLVLTPAFVLCATSLQAKIAARTSVGAKAAPKGIQAKRKPAEPQLPTRKSRRIEGKQSDNLALGDVYSAATDYVIMDGQQRAALTREAEDRRWRLDPTLAAQAVNLSGDKGKLLLSSIIGDHEERESELKVDATGIDTVNYDLSGEDIVKATEERIYSMAFHPRTDKLVVAAGDKRGNLSLWSADEPSDEENVVAMYRPHTSPVTQLHFSPQDATKLLSSSFDGSVRQFDMRAATFSELFGTSDNVGITSMALNAEDPNTFLVSCEDGFIWSVDSRQASSDNSKQSQFLLHEKKVNTVHQHPMFPFCIATASLDRTVCLWDMRKLKKADNVALVTMPHSRSVNCAYFSPGGEHLVTVGQDNYVNVFDTRDAKHHDAHNVAPTLAIPHNNQTGRWLTKLHASWDPRRKDRFVIGSMKQPRSIQIFEATRKNPIQELTSDYFNSVHSINVFHPTLDVIAGGNSSGRLALWRSTGTTLKTE